MVSEQKVSRLRRAGTWLVSMLPLAVVAVVVLGGIYGGWRYFDDEPVTYPRSDDPALAAAFEAEHFKYGSTGGERGWKLQFGFGIPYWMWIALPELVPELLPDRQPGRGYSSIGFIYEDDRHPVFDLPVGTQMRRVQGVDRVYVNCAFCHTGSVRERPGGPRQIVPGMPSNTLNLGAFTTFLDRAAKAREFRDRELMAKIAELEHQRGAWLARAQGPARDRYWPEPWGVVDRAVMRWVGVMAMRDQLLALMGRLRFIDFGSTGPGRVDTWNSPKALLGFDMYTDAEGDGVPDKPDPRELHGNVDFPSIWNQKARRGMNLHWTGNQCSTDERNLSAGYGTGATPATVDREKLVRMADWLWDQARPPAFPEERIDAGRLERGGEIYRTYCWECHGNGKAPFREPGDGGRVGEVEPIEKIGTDRRHLDSYTPELAQNQNTLYAGFPEQGEEYCREYREGLCNPALTEEEFEALRQKYRDDCYPARFTHFRKTYGYANAPLDGVWLRAPYLHNGSVPNLRYLLEPAANRPTRFYTGYDVYDFDNLGFVTKPLCSAAHADPSWCVAEDGGELAVPAGAGWRYDTTQLGNGNGGHEGPSYGTELPAEDKQALLEYLKTF